MNYRIKNSAASSACASKPPCQYIDGTSELRQSFLHKYCYCTSKYTLLTVKPKYLRMLQRNASGLKLLKFYKMTMKLLKSICTCTFLISRNQTQKICILEHTGADRKFNKNATELEFLQKVLQNVTECYTGMLQH